MLRTVLWYVSECFVASGLHTVRIWERGNAGCHSWNPLTSDCSESDPLMEGYKYNRQAVYKYSYNGYLHV